MSSEIYIPKRAMVIMAHPDDPEFGVAGTVARWSQAGCEVTYVLCTSGDAGIDDLTREEAAKIREAEQQAAANVVGVKNLVFLREPDGLLENTLALRKKLVREIRRYKPEVVFTMDPTMLWISDTYINHPDHRAAAGAAIDAIFPASGQPNLFEALAEEGLTAHKVRKVYIITFRRGDYFINITDTIDLKIKSLSQHKSQIKDPEGTGQMIKQWAAEAAKGKEMAYAETFNVITLISDEDFVKMER